LKELEWKQVEGLHKITDQMPFNAREIAKDRNPFEKPIYIYSNTPVLQQIFKQQPHRVEPHAAIPSLNFQKCTIKTGEKQHNFWIKQSLEHVGEGLA